MTSRREFLQSGAIVAAAPIVARVGFPDLPFRDRLVVFDDRFPESARFGACAESAGWAVRRISGDITSLWTEELSRRWARHPVPLAGLTDRPALFCLEHLGWDHRMRAVFHVEHAPGPNGRTHHAFGSPPEDADPDEISAQGELWPEFMAERLTGVRAEGRRAHGPSTASMAARLGDDESVLHSWIIAPVRRLPTAART